ncbi:MAG: hypothetical protein JWL90_2817 [Chthoniobacteraceae bacterium]|nr:hypothetical protein [Chthoniobacteraceae bacterium]
MKSLPLLTVLAVTSATLASSGFAADGKSLGYTTTPMIPGSKWHVHDGDRPQPKIVTPGTESTQEKAGTAPSDAVVLFDGKDLSKWKASNGGGEPQWKVENGYAEVHGGDATTKDEFGPDVQLHVEWTAPVPGVGSGQGRGNSGIFFYGRYEIQVLDCYENPTYPDGQATAIYGQTPPLVNASRKPGEWQTYDIVFNGPRFKDGKLETPAYATILHNGVLVQNHTQLTGSTPHQQVGTYTEHPEKGAIRIQDHNNPVRYRSLWIRELKPVDSGS